MHSVHSSRSADNTLPPLRHQRTNDASSLRPSLTGHDLMTIFPPSHAPPPSHPSCFGKQEREYLSSHRDEQKHRWPAATSAYSSPVTPNVASAKSRASPSASSSTSSASSSSSSSSSSSASSRSSIPSNGGSSMHVFSTRTLESKPVGRAIAPGSMPPTQIHAHSIPQGSGAQQFSILRMPLESFSNPNATTSQFTEFRTQAYNAPPSQSQGENVFSAWEPPSEDKRRSGKHTKRVSRVF